MMLSISVSMYLAVTASTVTGHPGPVSYHALLITHFALKLCWFTSTDGTLTCNYNETSIKLLGKEVPEGRGGEKGSSLVTDPLAER